MPQKNKGVLISEIRENDYVLGSTSKINRVILQENRDYTNFLPIIEFQYRPGLETMACVTFSALNCIEVIGKRKYNIEWNFSDRYTAKMSGTTKDGNYLINVAESIRIHHGLVYEKIWLFDKNMNTWEKFYSDIPEDIINKGKDFLNDYCIKHEWVIPTPDRFWEALKYGPIQVTVNVNAELKDGIYQKIDSNRVHHAVMLYKGVEDKYWCIFDHYDNTFKKYAWDFNFGSSMIYYIEKKNIKLVKSKDKNNKTVFFIDALGYRRAFYDEQHYNAVAPILGLAKTRIKNNDQTDWSQIEEIDEEELNKYPLGRPLFLAI